MQTPSESEEQYLKSIFVLSNIGLHFMIYALWLYQKDNQAQQKQDPIKAVVVYRDLETKQEKENFNNNLSSY